MNFEVKFQVPGQAPQIVSLNESRILIGTLLSNHLVLRATDVEPIHAMIESVDGEWFLTDLGSASGVKLNGKNIDVESPINPGDHFEVGPVTLEFAESRSEEETFPPPIPPPMDAGQKTEVRTDPVTGLSRKAEVISDGGRTRSSHFENAAQHLSQDEQQQLAERKDILFSPRKAKPSGSVLECVAYWSDTVLDVDLFHPKFKGNEQVTIGDPTIAHFISAGESDAPRHVFAEVSESAYKIRLLPGMEARFRKGGQVETHKGPGSHKLGRRDIAHIKHKSLRYFLLFVSPPAIELPRNGPKDPFFVGLSAIATLLYFALIIPIFLSEKTEDLDSLSDDQIAIINVPIKEQPKPKIEKPKVDVVEQKKPPETPPVPKPQPKKPEPVQVTQKEVPKPPKPNQQKAEVKKQAVKPLTENKAPQAAPNPLDKLQKAGEGMPSTGAKQPDFKLAGKDKGGPKGPSGGPRGGGNNQAGAARKGNQKTNVAGVEGVNNNKASGVNLSKLGLGVGKVLSKTGPGAVQTDFKSSVGGAGGGSGSASKTYGIGGGDGRRQSLGLGGGAGATNFGAGGSGGYLSGEGGKGGLGGSGLGRGKGGRPRPDVQLPAEDPVVGGGLTQQEVLAVIRANLNQIRHCYEQLLQRSPSAQGKLSTQFTIGLDGRVKSARIDGGTISDSIMKGCVTSRIQRWKFPQPRGGSDVSVVYPFVFTPL